MEATYRQIEHRQKCAEKCFLFTLTSLWEGLGDPAPLLPVKGFRNSPTAASEMLDRLFGNANMPSNLDVQLAGLDLSESFLSRRTLNCVNLRRAKLSGALLDDAMLMSAILDGAILENANLVYAKMFRARLSKARLAGARLNGAMLSRANLDGATLDNAILTGAYLRGAELNGASLVGSSLRNANLDESKVISTDLNACDMSGASLRSMDLSLCINLVQMQIDQAYGIKQGFGKTILPEGLVYPDHWFVAEDAEEDNSDLGAESYRSAFLAWRRMQPKNFKSDDFPPIRHVM